MSERFGELVLLHRAIDGARDDVAERAVARGASNLEALGAVGHGVMVMRSASHPLLMASRPMRSRLVIRLVGGGRVGDGPDGEPHWDVLESFTFDSVESMTIGINKAAADGTDLDVVGATTTGVAARAVRLAGRSPRQGDVGMCFTLRRRPDVERADMQRVWEHEHAGLVLRGEKAMGFDGYVQAHAVEMPEIGGVDACPADAMGFLTFRSLGRMASKSSLPAALVANIRLVRDEPRFVHPPATTLALGTWTSVTSINNKDNKHG